MLIASCDSCGDQIPRDFMASVEVRLGRTQAKFELCELCMFGLAEGIDEVTSLGVTAQGKVHMADEKWSAQEQKELRA